MGRVLCLVGMVVLGAAAVQPAGAAASPRALLDAERAQDVAVAGGEVLAAASTSRAAFG